MEIYFAEYQYTIKALYSITTIISFIVIFWKILQLDKRIRKLEENEHK